MPSFPHGAETGNLSFEVPITAVSSRLLISDGSTLGSFSASRWLEGGSRCRALARLSSSTSSGRPGGSVSGISIRSYVSMKAHVLSERDSLRIL